MSVIDIWFNN